MTDGFKGVIFDLDGTLLDSMSVWDDVDRDFLGSRGFEVPPDYIEIITPLGYRETAAYTIARFGLHESEDEVIKEWTDMALEAYGHRVKLKPYARELLMLLHENGVKLAVATATMPELCTAALRNNGVLELFDNITYTSEVGRGKEFPDIYLRAAEKMGVEPENCVVFEDIPAGISGANAGGFTTVGVFDRSSAHLADEMKNLADFYISDFSYFLERK